VTMPPSSPRSSTRPPSPTTSSMMVGRGSTAPVPCLSPWKPAWRGSSGSRPGSHHLPFACTPPCSVRDAATRASVATPPGADGACR
jgi:hypothetical protein